MISAPDSITLFGTEWRECALCREFRPLWQFRRWRKGFEVWRSVCRTCHKTAKPGLLKAVKADMKWVGQYLGGHVPKGFKVVRREGQKWLAADPHARAFMQHVVRLRESGMGWPAIGDEIERLVAKNEGREPYRARSMYVWKRSALQRCYAAELRLQAEARASRVWAASLHGVPAEEADQFFAEVERFHAERRQRMLEGQERARREQLARLVSAAT
jgi:hypothetical protein